MSNGDSPDTTRRRTDDSLRVERAKADADLAERLGAIEEASDAMTERARARADRVLAAARARVDQERNPPSSEAVARQRDSEDRALAEERAVSDDTRRLEREEHSVLQSIEREETDHHLSRERERADDSVSARDVFLGMVSHDLRNMLHGIMGFAALIAGGTTPESSGDVIRHAQRILRSGGRMTRLVGDLVDVASIDAGALAVHCEHTDPATVVAEAVDSFQAEASASGVVLAADVVAAVPQIPFDPARVLQVLANLLSNALKFTRRNGRITVRVEARADVVLFSVHDTGVGIPPDKLKAIFERYRQLATNDGRGVGLGLYISKCIVQGHGGRIWAESQPDVGSTFHFTIPFTRDGHAPQPVIALQ